LRCFASLSQTYRSPTSLCSFSRRECQNLIDAIWQQTGGIGNSVWDALLTKINEEVNDFTAILDAVPGDPLERYAAVPRLAQYEQKVKSQNYGLKTINQKGGKQQANAASDSKGGSKDGGKQSSGGIPDGKFGACPICKDGTVHYKGLSGCDKATKCQFGCNWFVEWQGTCGKCNKQNTVAKPKDKSAAGESKDAKQGSSNGKSSTGQSSGKPKGRKAKEESDGEEEEEDEQSEDEDDGKARSAKSSSRRDLERKLRDATARLGKLKQANRGMKAELADIYADTSSDGSSDQQGSRRGKGRSASARSATAVVESVGPTPAETQAAAVRARQVFMDAAYAKAVVEFEAKAEQEQWQRAGSGGASAKQANGGGVGSSTAAGSGNSRSAPSPSPPPSN
jgi:hypothetical protein